MTQEDVKKELERCARLTGKDVFVDAYKIIIEQEKEIERLKTENGQRRKLGILGYNVTVEFLDDVVSEHSADCKDIEKYAKQFRSRIITINEKEIKQAKIDILNKAKERAVGLAAIETYHICNLIDKIIKEVQDE